MVGNGGIHGIEVHLVEIVVDEVVDEAHLFEEW